MSNLAINPVSGEPIPPTTGGSEPEPLELRFWNEEAGCTVRPWRVVERALDAELAEAMAAIENEPDEDESSDGDDLHADDRCACGALIGPMGRFGLCLGCLEAEDEEYLDDDDEET